MLNIVILAAGLGRRMHSDLPKVLHPIAGRAMLDHLLDSALALNPQRCVLVLGHGADQIAPRLAARQSTLPAGVLQTVLQSPQLGTGHAVQQALPALLHGPDSRTLILVGDCPLVQLATLERLVAATEQASAFGLLTVALDDPTGFGRIVRDAQGAVTAIVEHKDATPEQRLIREINTGMMAVPTQALDRWLPRLSNHNAQGEYYLTDIVGMAVAEQMRIQTVPVQWPFEAQGVNSRSQQAQLERAWQQHLANQLLDAGVSLADPARLDVRGTLRCGRDVSLDVNVVIEGTVELGDGVQIGPQVVLRDVQIAAGARIEAFSHLEGCSVGAGAVVGPYARLRPGTVLGPKTRVGNFVEMKNARLGTGSKANHLSYVGDAEVGERVNIGAGTITCNYDGVNKHQTIIGDDAFIGSDTQLVAPVTVGAGATIGAGTTLTRDAPAGQLTVSRAKQTAVPGWKRPERKA